MGVVSPVHVNNPYHPSFQLLYDADIVEEKSILEWAAKPSKKYARKEVAAEVRAAAQPFLDWLQQAEEDDSDEEDEEDIEVIIIIFERHKTIDRKTFTNLLTKLAKTVNNARGMAAIFPHLASILRRAGQSRMRDAPNNVPFPDDDDEEDIEVIMIVLVRHIQI